MTASFLWCPHRMQQTHRDVCVRIGDRCARRPTCQAFKSWWPSLLPAPLPYFDPFRPAFDRWPRNGRTQTLGVLIEDRMALLRTWAILMKGTGQLRPGDNEIADALMDHGVLFRGGG